MRITTILFLTLTFAVWGLASRGADAPPSGDLKSASAAAPPAPAPAPPPPPPTPPRDKLTALQVEPAKFVLQGKWATQTLQVLGKFADGSVRDVTAAAEFKSANPQIAEVGKEGIVRPVSDGEVAISITAKSADTSALADAQATVKEAKNESVWFLRDVMPLASRLGCNQAACHGSAKGKGGLRLSMFGAEPDFDYEVLTRASEGRTLNRVEPAKSLLLLAATASIPHGGAQKIPPGSPEYNMLASWIAQGAPWGDQQQPKVVSVKVVPEEQTLQKGESLPLSVTAVYSDGSQRDATRLALYSSLDAKVAAVDANGRAKAEGFGEAPIIASYMRQAAIVRIVVPQPLPSPFPDVKPNNKIDELVFAKLRKLGIPPSEVCSDEVFVRRVFLDAMGTLPTPEEVRAFLADADPQKRSKLIDRLLERDEFADFWALKWGDLLRIKSEYPVRVWPRAVVTYYLWLRDSVAQNKPYDQFVRELLVSSGSNFRDGPCNFYRAVSNKDPQTIAETTALVFMGARLGCARCHGHPSENWTLDDNMGMAAFFAKVSFKGTMEWKEEVVFFNPRGGLWNPRRKVGVKPKFLGGEPLELDPQEDPRLKFADWLISPQNPWFAKNIANRVWYWLLGRGIVHEPDDFRPTNPPENRELLDYLAQELVAHKYDVKHVFRLILNSKVYQLSSKSNEWNKDDVSHFSHYRVRRLGAEELLDAVSQATDTMERFHSWIPVPATHLPPGAKAIQIPDADIKTPFLDLFGRPPRDTPFECERSLESNVRQSLHLVNSDHFEGKVAGSARIQRLLGANKPDPELVDELYLATLSRPPRPDEKQKVIEYLASKKDARAQAVQDLLWALLNTKEFLFNH